MAQREHLQHDLDARHYRNFHPDDLVSYLRHPIKILDIQFSSFFTDDFVSIFLAILQVIWFVTDGTFDNRFSQAESAFLVIYLKGFTNSETSSQAATWIKSIFFQFFMIKLLFILNL